MELSKYNPHDFEVWPAIEYVPRTERTAGNTDFEPANLDTILAGCAWLRDTIISAASLSEPNWYRAISIIARCKDGVALTHQFSKPHPGYDPKETDAKISHAINDAGPATCDYVRLKLGSPHCEGCPNLGKVRSPITIGQWRGTVTFGKAASVPDTGPAELATGIRLLTDLGNAYRLADRYGNELRYCDVWNTWLRWDETRWQRDCTRDVETFAHDTIELLYQSAWSNPDRQQQKEQIKFAIQCQSDKSITAMVRRARALVTFKARPEEFDGHPWLFNVANGTIDLTTGTLRAHARADCLTQLCPVAYDANAPAPIWSQFLLDIMAGRKDLASFLQRGIGYCLTGDDRERILFLLWGGGNNGKSTFLDIIRQMLGDYGHKLRREALMMRRIQAGQAAPEIAGLRGKRFAYLSETEEGGRLDEGLVKELTGREYIRTRDLYEKEFGFAPEFKIWIGTNHKPVIRGTDEAIWNRLPLVPFEVKFKDVASWELDPNNPLVKSMDKTLPQKLIKELPGILAWAVRGCLAWQKDGLQIPPEILRATEAFRSECDYIQAFLDECCNKGDAFCCRLRTVHEAYARWAIGNGAPAMSQRKLTPLIEAKGYKCGRGNDGSTEWKGLTLQDDESLK